MTQISYLIIRLLLAGIFVYGGWGAMTNPGGRPQKVAAAGIPFSTLAVIANGGLMVFAGLLLVVGIFPPGGGGRARGEHDPHDASRASVLDRNDRAGT